MKRTQIYLEDAQAESLDRRARASGTTRSDLIRRAVDSFMDEAGGDDNGLARWQAAVRASGGSIPRLPPGEEYVAEIRDRDAVREQDLERRWRR